VTLPAGVQLAKITFGQGLSALGTGVNAVATITPVFPGTKRLVWLATGESMFPLIETLTATGAGSASINLPAVDQDGWVDERGNPYKNWSYTIEVRYQVNNESLELTKTFQPTTLDPEVDFDLVFETGTSDPIIVIKQPVRSVNGVLPDESGNVVIATGGDSGGGTGTGEPGREVVLRNTGSYIQWTYEGEADWQDLIAVSELRGAAGNDSTVPGPGVEMRVTSTTIQWKAITATQWNDIVTLESLRGPKGDTGNLGNTGPAGPAGNVRLLAAGATSGPTTDPAGTIWGYRK